MTSIRKALVQRITLVLAVTFLGVVGAVAHLNLADAQKNREHTAAYIRSALVGQGLALVRNNSHALKDMVADNAFSAIQRLVAETVLTDEDIIYGIFMDTAMQPWAYADSANPDGTVHEVRRLDDPMAQWAAALQEIDYRQSGTGADEVYEFAAPVLLEGQRQGTIRYGFSTARMRAVLTEMVAQARVSNLATLAALSLVGLVAIAFALMGTRLVARLITRPLGELTAATETIAQGDYENPVQVRSDSEVGVLSRSFESMRKSILAHRQELEDKNARLLATQAELEELNQTLEEKVRQRTAELREVQAQLIAAARAAGMAEVAINVLHNIGNVINSVNVANQDNAALLQRSQLDALRQINALLAGHQDDLATFVATDPKGRLLAPLYLKLGEALEREHEALRQNTERMQKNIALIRSTIATQQAYAKVGGLKERFSAARVVEESLDLQAATMDKHHIRVERAIGEVPAVYGEPAKFHQVVDNLLTNARQALQSAPVSKRRIDVSLYRRGEEVVLEVADNGEGIPSERLTEIFRHGYTTKAQGHGFGLHSCANYLGEMGGSIEAQSDGPGQGALFRVVLPMQEPLQEPQVSTPPSTFQTAPVT